MNEPLRIILTGPQTERIRRHLDGRPAGIIAIGAASWPDGGKLVFHIIGCDIGRADDACRVARGEAKISRSRKPTTKTNQ